MILIDYSPVLISCAHSACSWLKKRDIAVQKGQKLTPKEMKMTVEEVHMHRMLNTLRMVNVQNRRKSGRPIICVDRKPYWRNDAFPNYKKNRKAMPRDMDWKTFFSNGEKILNAAAGVFGWQVLDIPKCEADDIIGTLVHEYRDEPHMIISPDGDFKQLQIYKNVQQLDVIRMKKVVENNPKKWLHLKIITGDKKDGIPNIVSDKDTFMMEGVRSTPIKNADKDSWSNSNTPLFFCDAEMLVRWNFNSSLLDLSLIPLPQRKAILEAYNEGPSTAGDLFTWFVSNGLGSFIDQVGDFQ